jgi:TM2 domain-containing membrane protein YozV
MRTCPNCGTRVEDHHINCPKCYAELVPPTQRASGFGNERSNGSNYQFAPRQQYSPPRTRRKDPLIAVLLAIIPGLFGIWGLGHIYVGQTARGVQLLITGIVITILLMASYYAWFLIFTLVCMVILALAWFLIFVWQSYEAYILAKLS